MTSLRKVQRIVQLRVACPQKGTSGYPLSKLLNTCKKCQYHKGIYKYKNPDENIVMYVECDFLKKKILKKIHNCQHS